MKGRPHQIPKEISASTVPGLISNAIALFPHSVWTILLLLDFCQLCSRMCTHVISLLTNFSGSVSAHGATPSFPPSPSLPLPISCLALIESYFPQRHVFPSNPLLSFLHMYMPITLRTQEKNQSPFLENQGQNPHILPGLWGNICIPTRKGKNTKYWISLLVYIQNKLLQWD